MALPNLIEIVPLRQPVRASVTVPGSKSITNRALILAALATGRTTLTGALWSEDTQAMVDCLQRLGFEITVQQDPDEFSNRTISVQGLGGKIPNGGTAEKPLELFVGNAGTAARFLAAFVCLGHGTFRLSGVERMHSRPQAALFQALRQLGCVIESKNDKLPVVIHGTGPRVAACNVSIAESSQFASALLLSAVRGNWTVRIDGQDDEEMPYVTMTQRLIQAFPKASGTFAIEADASSASYFSALDWVMKTWQPAADNFGVSVAGFPTSDWQIDAAFPRFLPLPSTVSRKRDLGDSIMTAIVMAALSKTQTKFTDLERLRLQECERVQALRTELTRCGADVREEGETLTIVPGPMLHGAEIETYNDHRMAMCFAILGLKIPGIKLKNPACVKKTFPNFFQKLGAKPAEGGLGVTILDANTGRTLQGNELFAE